MDSSKNNERRDIDWSDIKPSAIDRHQDYVFIAHVILAIIISILSLSGGLFLWATGTGLMTPILLFAAGATYDIVTGINWYRDEFIPHLCRFRMIPEFEADRFLNYKRWNRRTILVSGYLTTLIIQVVWSLITSLVGTTDIITIISGMFMIFILMIVVYLIVLLVLLSFFEYILNSLFSDVNYIIAIDEKRIKDIKTLRKNAKETDT